MSSDIPNLDPPKKRKKPEEFPAIVEPKPKPEPIPFTRDACTDADKEIGCYPGTIWKHYKASTIYMVVTTALHTETKEVMIVYQNVATRRVYTRPATMWLEQVKPNGTTRFTFVREKL